MKLTPKQEMELAVLHFRDKRPPHEVQFALEREISTLFMPSMENGKLCLRAKANVVGADYDFTLRLEAALPEKHLDSVAAIQQAIIAAVKEGARYYDSHKEGGTKIYWDGKRFVRSEYGDDPDERHFTGESDFLKMLYQFCHWKATSHTEKDQLSEIDTWRLIQRRMKHR